MKELEKNMEYANEIAISIFNLFQDGENNRYCHIDIEELKIGENTTEFFIGYLKAGTLIFNELTGDEKNNLEFTHILNQLCVQDLLKDTKPELLKKEEDK